MENDYLNLDAEESNEEENDDEALYNEDYERQALDYASLVNRTNRNNGFKPRELNEWYDKSSIMVYTTSQGDFIKFTDGRCFINRKDTFKPIDEFFYIPYNFNLEEISLEELSLRLEDINSKTRYSTETGGRLVFITNKTKSSLQLTRLNGNEGILISDIVSEIDKINPSNSKLKYRRSRRKNI